MKSRTKSITIEYEDGSSKRVGAEDTAALAALVDELGREFSSATADPASGRHVLVEWKDGWKEVFAVSPETIGIRRYCVIERKEAIGRLFVDREAGYPEMIQILRRPGDVERVSWI